MSGFLKRIWDRTFSSSREVREEIESHIRMRAELNRIQGMSEKEAAENARRQFGNPRRIAEDLRALYVHRWLETAIQDLRYTLRNMGANPSFSTVAVLTLALGIGANAAIFHLLDLIVLRPLPVRDPYQLVELQGYQNGRFSFSYPLLREMAARQTTVEGIFASAAVPVSDLAIDGDKVPEPVSAWVATGNYFDLLGTSPQIGRLFSEGDDDMSATPVVVVSHDFWRRRLGGGSDVLGRTMEVNGVTATIIGVTRRGFIGERVGQPADFWMPISFVGALGSPTSLTRSSVWLQPMARLRDDIDIAQAEAELSLLWDQLREFSIQVRGVTDYRLELEPAHRGLGTLHVQFSQALWLLTGMVALVALLACCNLATLLLARGTARSHEIGVRLAIGAGRARLVRQLFTESLTLALLGGGIGLLLAEAASRSLVSLASAGETWGLETGLDWRITSFTASVTLIAALIFGLAPALTSTRVGLATALQAASPTHSGARARRVAAGTFVVAQVALSLVLVAGAGLLIRSFWNLTHQDLGFEPSGIVMARVTADEPIRALIDVVTHQALYRRVNEIPGVSSAAVGAELFGWIPSGGSPVALPGRVIAQDPGVRILPVSPGYTETLRIPLLRGRSITDSDRSGGPGVAVVNESAARLMFGQADPVGRVFTSGDQFLREAEIEVVGVVADFRVDSARGPYPPIILVPLLQRPPSSLTPNIVIRASAPPPELLDRLRDAVADVAPGLRIEETRTLDESVRTSVRRERLLAWLSAGFGALALVLAVVGLYGVAAYSVQLRNQEIGIRLALAARSTQVVAELVGRTAVLLGMGLVIGVASALMLSRSLDSLLYGLGPHDPSTFGAVAALLAIVGLAAAYLPAARATRLDPTVVLRRE